MKAKEMSKKIVIILICLVLTGCAGREPNPIATALPDDNNLTCESINAQIDFYNDEMKRLKPKTDKGFTNALWAIGGVAVIVPFFFMDFKDAEKIEYDAYSRRLNYLEALEITCTDTPGQAVSKRIKGYIVETKNGRRYETPVYEDGSHGEQRPFK